MARSLADLVDAGALAYSQSRLTRGDSIPEVLSKLARRYPQYQPALLSAVLDIAQSEERAKAEIASALPGQVIGPDVIPFVPGVPPGQYSADVAFTAVERIGGIGRRRFFRLDFDTTDIAIAHLLLAAGSPGPVPGQWQGLRDVLTGASPGVTVNDLAAITDHAIIRAAAQGPAAGAPAVNTSLTKEAVDIIMTNLPIDESADIIFPPRFLKSPGFLKKIVDPLLKSISRG